MMGLSIILPHLYQIMTFLCIRRDLLVLPKINGKQRNGKSGLEENKFCSKNTIQNI